MFAEMIKKKELREKLQQRQILKRDLNDGSGSASTNASDVQILEERSSAAFIQKSGEQQHPPSFRGAPQPQPTAETARSSASRGAPAGQNPPSAAAQAVTPHRPKGVKPPRPGMSSVKLIPMKCLAHFNVPGITCWDHFAIFACQH